jgi:SAM-dependent methyltransferase
VRPRRGLLLDVGCGAGDLLCALQADGWRVRGVEPGPAGVAVARSRGLDVEQGRFEEAGERLDGRRYDAVVLSGVVEHLHDPVGALRRARMLLAPGGVVAVLYVPLLDSLEAGLFGTTWLALDLPRHLTHFDKESFVNVAAAAGLEVERVEPYSRRHSAATLVASLAPSLQKHRFYQEEGRRPRLALAARKALWFAAIVMARPFARAMAAAGCEGQRSYFLRARAE